jgi:probable F420-dependent oxidoreductase
MEGAPLGVFLEALPAGLVVDYAKRAEAAGFTTAWLPEITFGDAFVPATAAAMQTDRLVLATGVVGIWARSPVTTAMTAASLHELSGGRLVLGLGLQSRSYVNEWHGARYERPLRAMREYLTIVRQILDGEEVTFEGEIFRVRGFSLTVPPQGRVPIYVAAIAPQMVELAGELADGVIGYCWSLEYFSEVVLPHLEVGASRAGRSLGGFDVACGFPSVVGDDGIDGARGQAVMFATATSSSPGYVTSLERAGFGAQRAAVEERVRAADARGALAAAPDAMVDACTLSGPRDHVLDRIQAYRRAGMTTVVLNPAPPRIWFPLYAGHFPPGTELPEFSFPEFIGSIEACLGVAG